MGRYKKNHLDWVVVVAEGGDPNLPEQHLECKRCHQTRILKFPVPIKRFVVVCNAFQQLHAECVEGVPVQVSLPLKEE